MTPSYQTSCPNCGGHLQPVCLDPQSAPWLCARCSHGFWPSELSPDARAAWRPAHRDFGRATVKVRDLVAADRRAAHTRGTSVLPEQVTLIDAPTRGRLAASPHLDPEIRRLLQMKDAQQ